MTTQKIIANAICRRPWSYRAAEFKVGVFAAGLLGDFVLASGAIRLLADEFGEENTLLLVWPQAEQLAALLFPSAPRMVVPFVTGRFLSEVVPVLLPHRGRFRRFVCEKLICLRHQRFNVHEALLSWVRSGRSYGFENDPYYAAEIGMMPSFSPDVMLRDDGISLEEVIDSGLCLELERNRLLMEAVLQRPVGRHEILPRWEVETEPSAADYLLVAPYGSAPIRSYPEPQLLEVLRTICREHVIPVRLVGNAAQRAGLEVLASQARRFGIAEIEIAETHSLDSFLAAVRNATAVVAVETSTAHFAVAYDKPAVLLLGGGVYGMCAPWRRSARQTWITNRVNCYHCHWHCRQPEPVCLTKIPPERVATDLSKALHTAPSRSHSPHPVHQ